MIRRLNLCQIFSLSLLIALFCFALMHSQLLAESSETPASSSLSDDELGHLVNFARLTNQPLDDWSGWEAHDQEAMESYRYQMAFMAYALALQQYHSVPAWREVHRATLDRLIERMLQKPVWEFWAVVSKTRRQYDPDWEGPQPSQHDPVGKKNIMYSGHLVHMAALYEMFYRDRKWSQPGAFEFRWDANESYKYDLQSLLKVIRAEMLAPREKGGACVAGVECEPNLIFPECNQHPLMAFQLNDALNGTMYYPEARKKLGGFFDCAPMYDPSTGSVANCWRVKQAKVINLPGMPSASADGWTGAFTYSWNPELVRANYEKQKARNIKREPNGDLRIAFDPMFELGLGFFALLARELGDEATAQELFAHAEKKYAPIREKGSLHYPVSTKDPKNKVSNTLDRVIALARSNRTEGLTRLHQKPWGDSEFDYPLVEGVDFPRVLVSEARWIADRKTLVIEMLPGYEAPKSAAFRITGLKSGDGWSLLQNGKPVGGIGPDSVASGAVKKGLANGTIEIELPLAARSRIELRKL